MQIKCALTEWDYVYLFLVLSSCRSLISIDFHCCSYVMRQNAYGIFPYKIGTTMYFIELTLEQIQIEELSLWVSNNVLNLFSHELHKRLAGYFIWLDTLFMICTSMALNCEWPSKFKPFAKLNFVHYKAKVAQKDPRMPYECSIGFIR